jgi:hypothetical protein
MTRHDTKQAPHHNSRLDPRTASVLFYWGPDGDNSDGEDCIGRRYYWCDPAGVEPSVRDLDFRQQHPEISDEDWQRLFREAFYRGKRRFLQELQAKEPDLFQNPEKAWTAWVDYLWERRPPSQETLEALRLVDERDADD